MHQGQEIKNCDFLCTTPAIREKLLDLIEQMPIGAKRTALEDFGDTKEMLVDVRYHEAIQTWVKEKAGI